VVVVVVVVVVAVAVVVLLVLLPAVFLGTQLFGTTRYGSVASRCFRTLLDFFFWVGIQRF